MKKILALLAVVLGVVSCQTEPEGLDVNVGGEQDVTICVTIPETETRAGGNDSALGVFANGILDAQDATMRYILQVYYKTTENGVDKYTASKERLVKYSDDKSVVFPVRLVPGRNYQFVVWADVVNGENAGDKHYITTDLAKIELNNTWVAMDETRDAFTATQLVEDYSGTSSINITLKRPFAKLRVVTTDMVALNNLGIMPKKATVTYSVGHYNAFNALAGNAIGDSKHRDIKHENFVIASYGENIAEGANMTLFTDYFFAEAGEVVKFELDVFDQNGVSIKKNNFNTDIAVNRNYLTTISGNILTDGNNVKVDVQDAFAGDVNFDNDKEEQTITVNTANDFVAAVNSENIDVVVLNGDIDLDDLLTRADSDLTLTVSKALTIDLNGKTLSATSTQTGKNYDMFFVTNGGDLTVKNGNIVYEHRGENMGWNNCTDIFRVSFSGKLTLEGVTAENKGGSAMAYVVDMSNATNLFVNIDNSTLKSTYIPVRVFNNNGKHNVTIKNTTLNGKYCFWVQYWLADGRNQETLDETLNISIYNLGNTFTYTGASAVIYGFNETIYANDCGITKTVSEDGTVVTLGSMTDNGIVCRGVAGTEENTTIKKVVVEEGVAVLYDRTFRRFYALEEVVLPSTLTTIGAEGTGVFQSCNNLKTVVLPENLTVLGNGSFQECSSLESINIPTGVTRIESDALRNTGLKSVEFHAGVTYFGAQAFRDCKQLTEVVINAPEFTMEGNTFGIMAAPFTPMTIYVANAEMKAYVESKLTAHCKTYITVVAPEVVKSTEALENALATEGAKMVAVAAGEYTFPSSSVKAGQTIICKEDTVFTGTSSLNINGATVVGATFKNVGGQAVSGTVYGTFKNCTFEGSETLRWCYTTAGQTTVFENCVVKTTLRGVHFDGMDGNVIFRNCEINGFNAYSGKGTITFEGCTFGNDASNYNGLNIYSNTNLVNCTFNYVSGKTNFIDMEGTGKTLTITNCTATLDGAAANVADFVGGSKLADNTVVYK